MSADGADRADDVTLARICAYFARLGLFGFGGPVALVGYMQRDWVEERRWATDQEYRDGLGIAQMAPGPLAAQLAMWLAFVRGGIRGATLASFAFMGPPFLIVLILGWLYVTLGGAPWFVPLFYGIGPAAIAIIAIASYRLLPLTVGRDRLLTAIAVVVGLITYLTRSEVAVTFLGGGLLAMLVAVGPGNALRWVGEHLGSRCAAIGAIGPFFPPAADELPLLLDMGLFFIKAGAFVFGSGLAIVPFLREGLLVEHRWLTEREFLDAVAVGLITPGPIVIAAAFVGFLIAGLPGALIGAFGVFLPVYLFVILPGRWFLRWKDAPAVRGFIGGVSAAATGAIVAAALILARQAIVDVPTGVIAAAALATLLAIRRWKPPLIAALPEPVVVVAAGVAGLLLAGS